MINYIQLINFMKKNKELNIDEIKKIKNEKNNKNIKIYDYIYSRIEFLIKQSVKNNKMSCDYTVPSYIVGFPVFDLDIAVNHCIAKLIKNGFVPFLLNVNTIRVTWQFEDREPKLKKSVYEENNVSDKDEDFVNSLIKYKMKH